MRIRFTTTIVAISLVCALAGGAAQATPITAIPDKTNDPFPRHDTLNGQVEFWRNVYGRWSLGQVALHDMDYPGIIYEVVDLPGPTSEAYTAEQRKFVDARRSDLQAQLQSIEQNYQKPASLTEQEREILARIVSVAGESAVIGAANRVRSQRGLRERFRRGVEISGRYDATFRDIFSAAGLPEDLAYLPHVESSFQSNARSSAGAVGIWQFTRSAGRLFLKVNRAVDERLDPVASARGAARYLSKAYESLGDWAFAVTSYNHGVEGMMRAKKQVGPDFAQVVREYQSRSFGFASKNFYTEFLAARDVAGNHDQYFPEDVRLEPPLSAERVLLAKKTTSAQLARTHNVSLREIVDINPAWSRRAARGEVALPAGIEVWLPTKTKIDPVVTPPQLDSVTASTATSRNYHVVRNKESLYSIAARYGVSIAQLKALNGMPPDEDLVRIGQKLLVVAEGDGEQAASASVTPAQESAAVVHVVRKGETPFAIAANYGISVAKLLSSNDLTRDAVIYPGQRFRIPLE